MSTYVVVFTVIAVVVILIGVIAWVNDARRNTHVAEDEDRFEDPRKGS